MAERVGSKPGQALPPPTGAAARPSGALRTCGAGSLMCGLVSRLEARPGSATARGRRGQALRCPSYLWGRVADRCVVSKSGLASPPPMGPQLGRADQAARLSETAVTFAGAGRASPETPVAFAGEKWVFLVRFSVAVVMLVSTAPCWG